MIMREKTTELGFRYFDDRPPNTRPGTIGDFLQHGRKKVGMEYLTYSEIRNIYYINVVRERTTGAKIKAYIDAGILFVFTNENHIHEPSNVKT